MLSRIGYTTAGWNSVWQNSPLFSLTMRAFFAFARGSPMQLRGARQHRFDRVARLVQDDAVADREWLLLVRSRLEQPTQKRQLPAFPADLDMADLGIDA